MPATWVAIRVCTFPNRGPNIGTSCWKMVAMPLDGDVDSPHLLIRGW